MPFASKRFAPIFGVVTLLILVALAGSALSNSKRPPNIGQAAASVELSEPSEPQANAEAAAVAEPTSASATPTPAAPETQQPPQATPIRGPIRNCKSLVFRKFPCQEAYLIL